MKVHPLVLRFYSIIPGVIYEACPNTKSGISDDAFFFAVGIIKSSLIIVPVIDGYNIITLDGTISSL